MNLFTLVAVALIIHLLYSVLAIGKKDIPFRYKWTMLGWAVLFSFALSLPFYMAWLENTFAAVLFAFIALAICDHAPYASKLVLIKGLKARAAELEEEIARLKNK